MPRPKSNRSPRPTAPVQSTVARRWSWGLIGLLLIWLAIVSAYRPALNGGMLLDDNDHITKPELRSVEGLYRIWFEVGATYQYYPLLYGTFWVEHRLWGDSVFGYHLVTLFWHMLAGSLLYCVLVRLKIPGALLAAAIFGLHPVMVESVAWMSEQKNTLAAVFCLSAMLAYLKFDESRQSSHYLISLALYVLGLLTKPPMMAMMPAALLVIFWWQRGHLSWKRDVSPLVPFFVLGALAGVMTAWMERKVVGAEGVAFELTLLQKCLLAGRVVWFYIGKLVWPVNLIFMYPRWNIDPRQWWQWLYPVATLGVFIALWAVRRRWRGPLAAGLLFVGTLTPVLGFLNVYPFIFSFVADHFQYMASLPIIVLISASIAIGLQRVSLPIRRAGVVLCILVLGALAALTSRQCRMYADVTTLYRTIVDRNPDAWAAQNNLGTILSAQRRHDEAIEHYREAVRVRPDYFQGHFNLGAALATTGQLPEAYEQFHKALALKPNSVAPLRDFGDVLANVGRHEEAIKEYQAALALGPDDPVTLNKLGAALTTIGQLPQAIERLRRAVDLSPNYAEARGNLGNALVQSGNLAEGVAELQRAASLDPSDVWTISNLGIALVQAGQVSEGIAQLRRAVQLSPTAEAHTNLGIAFMHGGDLPQAIEQYQAAIQRNPNYVQAYVSLAQALKLSNRTPEAVGVAERGIEVARSIGDRASVNQLEDLQAQLQAERQKGE